MKRWPVVFLFVYGVTGAMGAGASLEELAPPQTKVAIGINVRGLLNSPLLASIGGRQQDALRLAASQQLIGFDPFQDLDQVTILSTGAGEKPPMVMILRGRFDAAQMAPNAPKYHDVPVLGPSKGSTAILAIVDGETAIAGEPEDVHAAIDRRGSGAQLDAAMTQRMEAARQRYDVWGVGECPEGISAPGEGANALRSIDRFSFGAALRQGLELTAEFHARSSEDAVKITAAMALLQASMQAQMKKDGTKFELHSEEGTFQVSLTVPEEQVRQAIESQKAAVVSAMSQGMGVEFKPVLPTAAESAPNATLPVAETTAAPMLEALTPPPPSVVTQRAEVVLVRPEPEAKPAAAPSLARPLETTQVTARSATLARDPVGASRAIKPAAKVQVVNAPNGDTLYVKLPGAK